MLQAMDFGKPIYDMARCLFCLTGWEKDVADRIDGIDGAKAIIPMRVKRYKERGVWREEQKPLFPGYVFVYSDKSVAVSDIVKIDGAIRLLCYEDSAAGELEGEDAKFAKTLWDLNGKVGVMKAAREGQTVRITDGVFKALKGRVVAMDRRKMTAKVELGVAGSILTCWLSYEIIDVINDKNEIELEPIVTGEGEPLS